MRRRIVDPGELAGELTPAPFRLKFAGQTTVRDQLVGGLA